MIPQFYPILLFPSGDQPELQHVGTPLFLHKTSNDMSLKPNQQYQQHKVVSTFNFYSISDLLAKLGIKQITRLLVRYFLADCYRPKAHQIH